MEEDRRKEGIVVNTKGKTIFAIVASIMALGFSAVAMKVDVGVIGETQTEVGLSHINEWVFDALGTNMMWYEITTIIGYVAIGIAALWALVGFIQLVKRRNLLAVDGKILALGILYTITIGLYVAFTKIMINGRPIILPTETAVEPSFPSSHTLLVIVVCVGTMMIISDYIKSRGLITAIDLLLCIMIAAMVAGRLVSGAHWVSDIVAGILIGIMLLSWYDVAIAKIQNAESGYGSKLENYHPKH